MEIMRRIVLITILLFCGIISRLYAQELKTDEPLGAITYCLPSTTIRLDVELSRKLFYAGPYAKYANKYLGIDVKQKDEISSKVSKVEIRALLEADQSARYSFVPGRFTHSFLQMTAQGLVSTGNGNVDKGQWRFLPESEKDFSDKAVVSNLTSQSATLVTNQKVEDTYSKIAVEQEMIVEKSLETKAQEAADMILKLRKKRVQIVTGDTDATYSGEAMAAALKEIRKLEDEYMSLFIGYTVEQKQSMSYDVVPDKSKAKQVYIAFRVSQQLGLVPVDNVSGKPYMLLIEASPVNAVKTSEKEDKREQLAYYRIPATAVVKLSDGGVNVLCQTRMPIYQLGIVASLPLEY